MKKQILSAEYGLCSGGLTTYEFALQNVPFGIICQNRHQLITANEWRRRRIAFNLGLVSKKTPSKITKFLHDLEQNKIEIIKSTKLFDGLGAKRVTKEILKLI